MTRTPWPLAALAMLAATVAGCSNGSAGRKSNDGNSAATVAHNKAVKFAECMRTNGVSRFPDPDASGALTIDGVLNGSSLNADSAAWKQAISACKELEPAGFTGGKVTPQQRTARLEFARCIRDHGVPDFPDPTPSGPLVDTNRVPSTATPAGLSALNAAMRRCRDFGAAAGATGGR